MEERLKKQMEFLLEVDKLKFIQRQTYLSDGKRKENDAEHSWHLAMMAVLLAEHSNEELDLVKVITMVLIHDIVEIDAGDTYAYDAAGNESKRQREVKAADRIFHILPQDQAKKLRDIWEEFEAYETPEAKFAHVCDNVQPLMLNDATEGLSWKEHEVKKSQVLARNQRIAQGSVTMRNYVDEMINKNVESGNLKDE
ncbi:MAG TPA: HD domain-containing protein [Candidatus Blautia pullicola]|uniref:5'-deoxynucleotidase n=1 Tax=Candidatus Blautia pullicola TaxID=2838498 RepID=A0A9D2FT94_9FIRM|nr:HD domain-containing protein [Candidatus Blautia pullicola]